jgi:hypothetical protein
MLPVIGEIEIHQPRSHWRLNVDYALDGGRPSAEMCNFWFDICRYSICMQIHAPNAMCDSHLTAWPSVFMGSDSGECSRPSVTVFYALLNPRDSSRYKPK